MTKLSKKQLFTTAIISALTLTGCGSSNRLIVPDGSKRVPINCDAKINGTSIHQDPIVKHD